jgi:hypothetical protein
MLVPQFFTSKNSIRRSGLAEIARHRRPRRIQARPTGQARLKEKKYVYNCRAIEAVEEENLVAKSTELGL